MASEKAADKKDWARRKLAQQNGEDDVKGSIDKMEFGLNKRRFLPRPGEDQFYLEVYGHFHDNQFYRCSTTTWFGRNLNLPGDDTLCPLCKRYNRQRRDVNKKYPRGSEEGKKAWKVVADQWGPRVNYYANVYDPDAKEIEVKVLRFGPMILTPLLTDYVDHGVQFFSIKNGRAMHIKKKKKGPDASNVEYHVSRGEERENISEMWPQLKAALHDLDAHVGPVLAPEEVEARLKASEVQYDEEEEAPRKKKAKPSSDEDSESGDAPEDEEPEEKPKAKVKPKCFGDPDVHDPEDDACQDCAYFKRCKATPEVAEAYEEGRYDVDVAKAKKPEKVEKKPKKDVVADEDEEEDDDE